jgi:hypothetical protein
MDRGRPNPMSFLQPEWPISLQLFQRLKDIASDAYGSFRGAMDGRKQVPSVSQRGLATYDRSKRSRIRRSEAPKVLLPNNRQVVPVNHY